MIADLLQRPIEVVNVGLAGFAQDLASQHVPVVHVEWTPPARGDAALAATLAQLAEHDAAIASANAEALRRILDGEPVVVDVQTAGDVIAGLRERVIQHAGPPIEWDRMCGPLRGAVAGAIVYEGWARDLDAATELAACGGITFRPNHDAGSVGPMTGMITQSMPVFVVENRTSGNRAYCTINEGLGKVMRFGGNDASVIDRLRWLRDVCGPRLGAALRAIGGISLGPLIARGLAMGDEMHQRNVACSALFLRAAAPAIVRTGGSAEDAASVLAFIGGNDQFFLNIAMAMGKAITDPARGIAHSTLVTAMCRNGTDFGIRVSGTGDRWFTAQVEMPQGLYFPGYSEADANPDIGDSAILETIGLGAFAMAASPAVVGFVGGGGVADALDYTRQMAEICIGTNAKWPIPMLDFAGAPSGIDVRRVVETGIAPAINTGIAHRKAGVGQVGAGIARAPLGCFDAALRVLAEQERAR
ncbi:MAG TPA: DUF1116 domain-containing protein [Casimicrobiaceae bacterium]|nr:DUF1116 domain-containing protein [Casimicrobiaceae bacterium]